MNQFSASLESWQLFFSTVALAAATLTGLLFVSLSLNRERLTGRTAKTFLATARMTFSDFLYVLMLSLVFIIPHLVPLSLTVALLVLGLSRAAGLVMEYQRSSRGRSSKRKAGFLLREFGLPAVASVGLIAVAIAIYAGVNNSIYGLVGVIAALLLSACWRAWLLLVEE